MTYTVETKNYTDDVTCLNTKQEVLEHMQALAVSGQEELSAYTQHQLLRCSERLIGMVGADAHQEYLRYIMTAERGLDLPSQLLREQLDGKTILVTGGTGLIGSALVRELIKYGPASIVSISRGMRPHDPIEGVEYVQLDVRNQEGLKKLLQTLSPDIIYHTAAEKHPAIAELEPERTITTNIFGSENLIAAAEATGVPQIVYASTGKATRPYSPDTYASSKKAGEWLFSQAAARGRVLCSAVRFTHVVDNSNIQQRIINWIDNDEVIRLHKADEYFYIQSARESAHLLLNAGLEAVPGVFGIQAIRSLDMPVNLTELALGAMIARKKVAPIYFCGVESGYEEKPWPHLYEPTLAGDTSPLINAFEADSAATSAYCPEVDRFNFSTDSDEECRQSLLALDIACRSELSHSDLKRINNALAWRLLDARLRYLDNETLVRVISRILNPCYNQEKNEDHLQTDEAVIREAQRRQIQL